MKKFVPLVLLASLSPAFATTVQNLDAVPGAIQHTEGKQIFAEQMAGATPAKGFGELPQGLSENQWIGWVAPNENPNNLILTGAKAWGKDGKYIGVACFADNQADAGQAKKYADNTCPENYNNGRANKLYLGVFSWQNQQLQPIARLIGKDGCNHAGADQAGRIALRIHRCAVGRHCIQVTAGNVPRRELHPGFSCCRLAVWQYKSSCRNADARP